MMKTIFANRIGGSQFGKSNAEYKFEKIKKAKRDALKTHPDVPIIDFGVGEPDKPAHESIIDTLRAESGKAENRFYADNGIEEFQYAAASYMESVFGVQIATPTEQIIHGIGSKPVLAMLPLAFINPGDVMLNPVPGYPITATYSKYLGAEVTSVPLLRENGFLPDLGRLSADTLNRVKLLYLNYPNNPTGASADVTFFEAVIRKAKKHGFLIVHDAAYSALTFDGCKPISILSVPGAMGCTIEVHSLSKAFNMTGWRLAFVAGRKDLVKAYGAIKDNTDSGQFRAIQKAGAFALQHPNLIEENRNRYSRRFDLMIPMLRRIGFDVDKPKGSFFCYTKIPKGANAGVDFQTAEAFSTYLIRQAAISTVPWDDAGSFVRFSVTFEVDTIEEEETIIFEAERRMENCEFNF